MDTENRNQQNILSSKAETPGKSFPTPVAKTMVIKTPTAKLTTHTAPKSAPRATTSAPTTLFSPASSVTSMGSTVREAARVAKMQKTTETINKVAQLKEKWAKEKEEKSMRNKERRALELQRLQVDNSVAAEIRRKALEKQKEFADRENAKKAELLSSSLKARTQLASDLEKQAKAKRRISIFLNGKMQQRAKEKEEAMKQQKKDEEINLLASRRLDFLETRHAKEEDEVRRRDSLANRTLSAQKQKKVNEEQARKAADEEKDLIELRHQNWKDEQAAKHVEHQRRRESLAGRLDAWRAQKKADEDIEREEETRQLDFMTTRHQDWQDIEKYKDCEMKRTRDSLAGRLDKWRQEKAYESEQQRLEAEVAATEQELRMQSIEDKMFYEEAQKESRRQSLSYRLDKARKDRDLEQGQKALLQEVMEEEKRIQDLDRLDMLNHRQKMLDARRQSLEYRNQTEYQERMRLEGERQAQKAQEAADRELAELAWRDVKAAQERDREASRRSISWRIAEARRQHELSLGDHRDKLDAMHRDLALKRLDWFAVRTGKEEEKERSRRSISLRVESWRVQKMAEEKLAAKKEMMLDEEARLREQDREDLIAAKFTMDLMEKQSRIKGGFLL